MNFPKCNLHTHSTYCDGSDTPEQTVQKAIELGMTVLGFSGHSYTSFDSDFCMTLEGTEQYKAEVRRLSQVYSDRLKIYCGIEQDIYSDKPAIGYDYVIGSVHYVKDNGKYLSVDDTEELTLKIVREHFDGNFYHYVKRYYDTVAEVANQTKCNIVGHFDLIQKFNRDDHLFDSNDYRYRRPAIDALDALLEKDMIFEINTGAISRGYQTLPYPSPYLLRRIAEKRGRVILSSDAHKKENLMYGFEDAVRIARSCGVGGFSVKTDFDWKTVPIGREYRP